MKFSHIMLVVILFTMTACEDFLVRKPKDQLSPDTYFRTEMECQLFTNNFYTYCRQQATSIRRMMTM